MTNEETEQVNAYIQKLQAQHTFELQAETRARQFAQADSLKMGQAVHEIWKLANTQSTLTPTVMAQYTRQIINYYAPDFDIPF